MDKPNLADAATKIMNLLMPFDSDERRRAVQAALTLLGEPTTGAVRAGAVVDETSDGKFPTRAEAWLRQNALNREQLEHVYHFEGEAAELITAAVPGKTDKERTLNVYVLVGLSRLFINGDPTFDDKAARQACKNLGCFNETNHSSYMKHKGNRIAGSKDEGWKLTAPGMAHGAMLIKELGSTK